MSSTTRYRRMERNREKYRNYPFLDALFKIAPIIGKVLLYIAIVVVVYVLEAVNNKHSLTGSWTI